MEIAVVDDEKVIREQIRELAEKYEPGCHVKTYKAGEELLAEGAGFDVAAFHYLLKPVEEKKFAEVFMRAKAEVEKRRARGQETIFIKTRNRGFTIQKHEILYVENRGKKVEIHTGSEVMEMYASMNEMEKQLGADFCRCHRGYLVNMAYIAEYENDSISLCNGEKIFMAKERYSGFVKTYMRYLKSGGTVCV